MDSSTIINTLEANGWTCVRTKGDHRYYRKKGVQRPTCVPHPVKDIPIGTLKAIERQQALNSNDIEVGQRLTRLCPIFGDLNEIPNCC